MCRKLSELSFADRAFLTNSGTEAMEAALKLARRHFSVLDQDRTEFISTIGGFHGRSLGALSVTHNEKYRSGCGPLIPGVSHIPFNDAEALAEALSPRTAALVLEPIQGNSGVLLAAPGYLEAVRQLCDEAGCLLILDEIQTGVGRTGEWFAYQHTSIQPDILASAKALGGGLPLGAMLTTEVVAAGFEPGVHGSTFGGNPLACAAGLATLEVIEEEHLLQNTTGLGDYFADQLQRLCDQGAPIQEIRHQGLILGIELGSPAKPYQHACRRAGLLVTTAGGSALRVLPPLNTTADEIDQALTILERVLV
jgi:acetylornithine/succinyldiaminopimelate/putrescine aminotransferase